MIGRPIGRGLKIDRPQKTAKTNCKTARNGGPTAGASLALILKTAAGRARAEAELGELRRRLFGQSDLVRVCDQVCGQEQTPREAGGGDREALRVEAVLKVALDILAMARCS